MITQNQDIKYGFKFLDPYGRTVGRDMPGFEHKRGQLPATQYPLPNPGEKWGPWFSHPAPCFDGQDCGEGRFHIMKNIDARYAPKNWTVWFVQARGICGESDEKFGAAEIRLRMIRPEVLHRIGRLGHLRSADLSYANLRYANLSSADLSSADLRYANLSSAGSLYKTRLLKRQIEMFKNAGWNVSNAIEITD